MSNTEVQDEMTNIGKKQSVMKENGLAPSWAGERERCLQRATRFKT